MKSMVRAGSKRLKRYVGLGPRKPKLISAAAAAGAANGDDVRRALLAASAHQARDVAEAALQRGAALGINGAILAAYQADFEAAAGNDGRAIQIWVEADLARASLEEEDLPALHALMRKQANNAVASADAHRDARRWEKAAEDYARAVEWDPGRMPIWVQLGHALKDSGRPADAVDAYRRALALDPSVADTWLNLGHAFKLSGEIDSARQSYAQAVALDPAWPAPQEEIAGLAQSIAAPEFTGSVISRMPPFDVLVAQATLSTPVSALRSAALQRPPEVAAQDRLQQPAALSLPAGPDAQALREAADAFRAAGAWSEAADAYARVLELDPDSAHIWVQLGNMLKDCGRLKDALDAYRNALARDEGASDTWLQIGHTLKLGGATGLAARAYSDALARDIANADARRELDALGDAGAGRPSGGSAPLFAFAYDTLFARDNLMNSNRVLPQDTAQHAERQSGAGRAVESADVADSGHAAAGCPEPLATELEDAERAAATGDTAAVRRICGRGRHRADTIDAARYPALAQALRGLSDDAIGRADAHRGHGERELAAEAYADALEWDASRADIWVQLGHTKKDSGQIADAVDAYRQSLARDFENADTWLNFGHALKLGGWFETAASAYQKAAALAPTWADPQQEIVGLAAMSVLSNAQTARPLPSFATLTDTALLTTPTADLPADRGPGRAPDNDAPTQNAPAPAPDAVEFDALGWPLPANAAAHDGGPERQNSASEPAAAPPQETTSELEVEPEPPVDPLDAQREIIAASGLFDEAWYLSRYGSRVGADDAIRHFLTQGSELGFLPNAYFDPAYYVAQNPLVIARGENPLVHYATQGERALRRPSLQFDLAWFVERYADGIGDGGALAYHLRHAAAGETSPNRWFDPKWYLAREADVAKAQIDPFSHFWEFGWKEGREPSPDFSISFYRRKYLRHGEDENPLRHFLRVGQSLRFKPTPDFSEPTIAREAKKFAKPSPHFEEVRPAPDYPLPKLASVYALYLTQFHAFPENDEWWGKGFTEWTNVARALPRFEGHYQPRIPRDLGFYDLRDPTIFPRQIDMAKAAGLAGFCFYYYRFNEKRLLETPLEDYLSRPELDFPFCLMWANENWTRRWDGEEAEVLISQDYMPENDAALVDDLARHFADPRYARVDGRPLFFIYRVSIIPDARQRIATWRKLFEKRHGMQPWFVMAQSFNDRDPRPYGMDGAVEFPPHKLSSVAPAINHTLNVFDDDIGPHIVRAFDDMAQVSLGEPAPEYPLIKTVFPSWDNDARRQGTGLAVHGSTPQKYQGWLSATIAHARENPFAGEPVVMVNAWNEWAEGAYLEPDLHFGGAYLNATARAIYGETAEADRRKILLVGHDAFPSGAQMLLLNLARAYKRDLGLDPAVLLLDGGALTEAYAEVCETVVAASDREIGAAIDRFARAGYRHAIVNTTPAGRVAPWLQACGFTVTALVHELPRLVEERGLTYAADAIAEGADHVVFAAEAVKTGFVAGREAVRPALHVLPQGVYQRVTYDPAARAAVRAELGLPADGKIVLNMGYGDLRKGVDLFMETAAALARVRDDVTFLWLGDLDPAIATWIAADAARRLGPDKIRFLGHRGDVNRFLSAADAFALTSREDPYPSVVLEAMAVGLPVVGFEGAGGFTDLLGKSTLGSTVAYGDPAAMADALARKLAQRRRRAPAKADAPTPPFSRYAFDLLKISDPGVKSVSVIVPSYNYARYMAQRLGSIFAQDYPVSEIIVLDDASTDGAADAAEAVAAALGRTVRVLRSERNTGNVFLQWRKAAELATGDYVWIAEADDGAEPTFLSTLAGQLEDPDVLFAYTDSRAIDADGHVIWPDYKGYYRSVAPDLLQKDQVFDSAEFAKAALAVKNLILNVSSILWRREVIKDALDDVADDLPALRLAGDWRAYVQACASEGKIAYVAAPLNHHRRHQGAVTATTRGPDQAAQAQVVHKAVRTLFRISPKVRKNQSEYLVALNAQFQGG